MTITKCCCEKKKKQTASKRKTTTTKRKTTVQKGKGNSGSRLQPPPPPPHNPIAPNQIDYSLSDYIADPNYAISIMHLPLDKLIEMQFELAHNTNLYLERGYPYSQLKNRKLLLHAKINDNLAYA